MPTSVGVRVDTSRYIYIYCHNIDIYICVHIFFKREKGDYTEPLRKHIARTDIGCKTVRVGKRTSGWCTVIVQPVIGSAEENIHKYIMSRV